MSQYWYRDWQHDQHAVSFDHRSGLDDRNLVRNYEGFNDVRLLREQYDRRRAMTLLEVGCATGEFFRYVRLRYPKAQYYGLDISQPALRRAKAKYPGAQVFLTDPARSVAETLRMLELPRPDVVYAKDVVQHHTDPFGLLAQLVGAASESVIVRLRTRDAGASEVDPALSCQYHYDGWMPYLVLNLEELIAHLRGAAPEAELVVYRHHMILGGQHQRYVPKALYLPQTGTAETAIGVFKQTPHPGRVSVWDRRDHNPRYTWDYRLRHAARQALEAWRVRADAPKTASPTPAAPHQVASGSS